MCSGGPGPEASIPSDPRTGTWTIKITLTVLSIRITFCSFPFAVQGLRQKPSSQLEACSQPQQETAKGSDSGSSRGEGSGADHFAMRVRAGCEREGEQDDLHGCRIWTNLRQIFTQDSWLCWEAVGAGSDIRCSLEMPVKIHPHRDKEWTAQHISLEFRGDGHAHVKSDCGWMSVLRERVWMERNIGEPQCKKMGWKHRNSEEAGKRNL